MMSYQERKSLVLYERRLKELEKEQERIKEGYARVSKDGEVYLDFSDKRTQCAAKRLIEKFAALAE